MTGRRSRPVFMAALALLVSATGMADQDLVRKGEYISRIAGCHGCHTDTANDGPLLAGGKELNTTFGTFYPPNITPHPTRGIGAWDDEDFIRALTQGLSPDWEHYYPSCPYTSYTKMRRDDLLALKAYIFSLPASDRETPPHELRWFLEGRASVGLWKKFYFDDSKWTPNPGRSPEWNRGEYIAEAISHCAECHSPRNAFGAVMQELRYSGTCCGPNGHPVPNITPHWMDGIGNWTTGDIVYFLDTGLNPQGRHATGMMADVLREGLHFLTSADRAAVAEYLHTLAPISHGLTAGTRRN